MTPEGVYDLEGLSKEWVGPYPHKAGTKGGSMYSGHQPMWLFQGNALSQSKNYGISLLQRRFACGSTADQ